MFERYTEKSRRIIFFARYEAAQHGAEYIETPCLLLAIMREDRKLMARLLPAGLNQQARLRADVEAVIQVREKIRTSVDLPLSDAAKRALACAAEEAERRHHKSIEPRHLLWGLLEQGGPETACLNAHGIALENVNADLELAVAETLRDARQALGQKRDPIRNLQDLVGALMELPPDRVQAGMAVLKALASGKCEISGTGPDGPFHFSFGGEPE
jgi:ATP-dependent Clp protease ATP-binding subunit ClpC